MTLNIIAMILILVHYITYIVGDCLDVWDNPAAEKNNENKQIQFLNMFDLIHCFLQRLSGLLLMATLSCRSTRDVLQDISKLDNLVKISIFSVIK